MAITKVDDGVSAFRYDADGGSFVSTRSVTTASLSANDLVVVTVTWGDSSMTVTSITAAGGSISANSCGAALAWSGSTKRQASYYHVPSGAGTVALSVTLSGTVDQLSLSYEVFRSDAGGTWAFDKRATATGGYGTTPISTASFSTTGAGVIALFAGHNYYNTTYTPNFGSDTYVGRTHNAANTITYNDAWWGYRINTAAQTNTTCSTDLPASGFDAYLGLQALSFVFTAGGGGGDVSVSLTGQSSTASPGSVKSAIAQAPSGQAVTASAGAIKSAISVSLTGHAITASAGSLTAAATQALGGQSATFSQGNVTTGNDVTASLTGQSASFSQGTITASAAQAIAGLAGTFSQGALTAGVAQALSGLAVSGAQGTATPVIAQALSGQQVTLSQGAVSVPGDVTVSLTGQSVSVRQGSLQAVAESGAMYWGLRKKNKQPVQEALGPTQQILDPSAKDEPSARTNLLQRRSMQEQLRAIAASLSIARPLSESQRRQETRRRLDEEELLLLL
jgi:hypothetical protein